MSSTTNDVSLAPELSIPLPPAPPDVDGGDFAHLVVSDTRESGSAIPLNVILPSTVIHTTSSISQNLSEIDVNLSRLAQEIIAIKQAQQEYELKLADLYQKRASLKGTRHSYTSLVAPITKIPNEVLSLVFTYVVKYQHTFAPSETPSSKTVSGYGALCMLMAVCSRWRETAIHTPHLWTDLDLSKKSSRSDGLMKRFIRSGDAPMNIIISDENSSEEEALKSIEPILPHAGHLGSISLWFPGLVVPKVLANLTPTPSPATEESSAVAVSAPLTTNAPPADGSTQGSNDAQPGTAETTPSTIASTTETQTDAPETTTTTTEETATSAPTVAEEANTTEAPTAADVPTPAADVPNPATEQATPPAAAESSNETPSAENPTEVPASTVTEDTVDRPAAPIADNADGTPTAATTVGTPDATTTEATPGATVVEATPNATATDAANPTATTPAPATTEAPAAEAPSTTPAAPPPAPVFVHPAARLHSLRIRTNFSEISEIDELPAEHRKPYVLDSMYPCLRRLSLSNVPFIWISTPVLANLTNLELYNSENMFRREDFLDLLRACPNLASLALRKFRFRHWRKDSDEPPEEHFQPVDLPALKQLRMDITKDFVDDSFYLDFTAPNLESLLMIGVDDRGRHLHHQLAEGFSSIKRLVVKDYRYPEREWRPTRYFFRNKVNLEFVAMPPNLMLQLLNPPQNGTNNHQAANGAAATNTDTAGASQTATTTTPAPPSNMLSLSGPRRSASYIPSDLFPSLKEYSPIGCETLEHLKQLVQVLEARDRVGNSVQRLGLDLTPWKKVVPVPDKTNTTSGDESTDTNNTNVGSGTNANSDSTTPATTTTNTTTTATTTTTRPDIEEELIKIRRLVGQIVLPQELYPAAPWDHADSFI